MTEAKQEMKVGPKVGDVMKDGTIFAGISPDTHKAMYATPADAPRVYNFYEADEYANNLCAHGHRDWRVPTADELNTLYENRNEGALKGTLNETGLFPAGWYWSSSPSHHLHNGAWAQRFSNGDQDTNYEDHDSSLRCVRG